MMRRRCLSSLRVLLALGSLIVMGCEAGFVNEAARRSLSSFITSVFSTAVNETINP